MSSGKLRIYVLSITLILLSVSMVIAGTTGKIAGKIIDKETGEPLVGVNVIVKGTTLGTTTNLDGFFTILFVPPGEQTVVASLLGYAPVTVTHLVVRIDQTSPVNVALIPQAIETGTVVIVAERNIVKKDVATSVSSVASEEIATLPVASVSDVMNLQAGVEDGMIVRGGTSDQLLFQIDGITQRDPRDNSPISQVPLTSVQEISIEKGGFNAEYGQVQSGIINIVAKEGSLTGYTGALQVKYAPAQQKYFGTSVFDPTSMWNRVYLDPMVCWTGTDNPVDPTTGLPSAATDSLWNMYTKRQYPHFEGWNSISKGFLQDDDPSNDLSPAALQRIWEFEHRRRPETNQPDYNIDGSFGGPVPFVSKALGNLRFFASYRQDREMFLIPLTRDDYKEYNWFIKVNSDINSSTKLMLTGSSGKFYTSAVNYDDGGVSALNYNPTTYFPPTDYYNSPITIAQVMGDQRASHIFTNSWNSAVEVGNSAFSGRLTKLLSASSFYEIGFEYMNRKYNTNPIAARDTSKIYQVLPGYYVDEAPYGYSSATDAAVGEPTFFFGGHSSQVRDTSKVGSYKLKFDLTTQATNEHLVKFGVELTSFNLDLRFGRVEPMFGSVITKENYKPYQVSGYIQDKIEMLGFIANLGFRLDVSNPNAEWVAVDPFSAIGAQYYSAAYSPDSAYPKQKAKVDVAFSPRLGISHPITENSKLYFNYGHFLELPAYQQVFNISRGTTGAMTTYGNPNLTLARTIAYELGYDHVLFNSYLLQIQGFYRDISDQQTSVAYTSGRSSVGVNVASNDGYSDIRGLEITLRKSGGDWIRGFASYTYQVATFGQFGNIVIDQDPAQQRINDANTQVYYQTKPVAQPHAHAGITFLTPRDLGLLSEDFNQLAIGR